MVLTNFKMMQYRGKLYGELSGKYFELKKTTEDVDNMESLLKEALDLLNKAFCHEGSHDLQREIEEGRWDGVRTLLERGSEVL